MRFRLIGPMDLHFDPEPPAYEREALCEAIVRLAGVEADAGSAWWREGIRENVTEGPAERPGASP